MKYRKLGKTGWRVSVLGFGAAPLGGKYGALNEKEAVRAVRTAVDLGVNFIDVAPYYGVTRAEALLGKALKELPREQFFLSTKVGRYDDHQFDFSAARVTRSVDESLKRLRVAHIDLLLCHDIEFGSLSQIIAETIPTLQKLKRQGKARALGISGLPLTIFKKVLDRVPLDAVLSYCHYCLNDITLVQLFPYLKAQGVGIINASPLSMGLLTANGPPAWHPAPAKIREACARAATFCRKQGVPLPKLALQFATANRDIETTLVGMVSAKEVKQNVRWLEERLDQKLLGQVQEILAPICNHTWPSGRKENG
jgi:L-galactose dehydrogenase